MRPPRRLVGLFAVLAGLLAAPPARADEDREAFFEGKAALAANDCKAAVEAFGRVKGMLRSDSRFLKASAKAHDCAGQYSAAIADWETLRKKTPDDPDIDPAIGDLRYKLKRADHESAEREEKDAARKAAADKAREARVAECLEGIQRSTRECVARHREFRDGCPEECSGEGDGCIRRCEQKWDDASCREDEDDWNAKCRSDSP